MASDAMDPPADVVVAGGGPAGLATAIDARQSGLEVLVVDRGRPPIDKACGEGLMPDGLDRLHELGVQLPAEALHPFRGIRYLDGVVVAEGRFPSGAGAGVRRTVLHQAMVKRATAVGVGIHWEERVIGLRPDGLETTAGFRRGRWIVAADGLRSPLRRWAKLAASPSPWGRFGVRRHYALAPWTDLVEVYWARDCEAYVTPVSAGEVGVALLWSGRKASFDALLASFPTLQARLAEASPSSRDRGAGPLRQRVRHVVRGNLALVGDAAGYVDAITGEGLSLAFHQATALGAALRAGDLGPYAAAHRRIGRVPDGLTRLLLTVERRPWLRRRVIKALARDPSLFSRILAVHGRFRPLRSLGLGSAPRFLWRLVQP